MLALGAELDHGVLGAAGVGARARGGVRRLRLAVGLVLVLGLVLDYRAEVIKTDLADVLGVGRAGDGDLRRVDGFRGRFDRFMQAFGAAESADGRGLIFGSVN